MQLHWFMQLWTLGKFTDRMVSDVTALTYVILKVRKVYGLSNQTEICNLDLALVASSLSFKDLSDLWYYLAIMQEVKIFIIWNKTEDGWFVSWLKPI